MSHRGFLSSVVCSACLAASPLAAAESEVDLSETPIPFLKSEDLPPRVGALIELGRGINEVGELSPGIEMPTGAVWQPALWVYGSARVAGLATDGDRRTRQGGDSAEIAGRVDLFANLQLTGTERVLAHFRPLDKGGRFARKVLSPDATGTDIDVDFDAESLFFEGDIGEMFPKLDPEDRGELDMGFAVGRFPVEFQNGYLIRDEMTAVGLSKTNVQVPGSSGVRVMGLWAFDHVNESNGARDPRDVNLFGLFVEGDFPWGLMEFDVAGTVSGELRGDQINVGLGWTGHSAGNNYSIHANVSQHSDQLVVMDEDPKKRINVRPNGQVKDYDGALLVAGYSTEINANHDLLYANGYWAEGDFGRLASNGTPPLGPVGLSYAGVGLGGYRPALWPRPLDSAGFAVGVQKFFADETANWALEFAHRRDLESDDEFGDTGGFALTTRFQRKFANRFLVQIDAYQAWLESDDRGHQDAENDDDSAAVRIELKMNF